jgi:hypothetical protein
MRPPRLRHKHGFPFVCQHRGSTAAGETLSSRRSSPRMRRCLFRRQVVQGGCFHCPMPLLTRTKVRGKGLPWLFGSSKTVGEGEAGRRPSNDFAPTSRAFDFGEFDETTPTRVYEKRQQGPLRHRGGAGCTGPTEARQGGRVCVVLTPLREGRGGVLRDLDASITSCIGGTLDTSRSPCSNRVSRLCFGDSPHLAQGSAPGNSMTLLREWGKTPGKGKRERERETAMG